MILVYTGNGKGKTSACLGQVVRALGCNMRVGFGQFMKRSGQAGEQITLATLLGDNFMVSGAGFFRNESERLKHREAAAQLIAWATTKMQEVQVLILDEALYALGNELVTPDELQGLIALAREQGTHLILSGRGLPAWLEETADIITEMKEIQHHYHKGCSAVEGIEF